MSAPILQFPRGTVVQFTSGEYSDFHTCGLLVFLIDADLPALVRQYETEQRQIKHQEVKEGWYSTDVGGLSGWLVARGFAMPVACSEVQLGAYGNFEDEFGVEELP